MKKLITFVFSFAILAGAQAQTGKDDYFTAAKPKLKPADRVSASFSAGAGITTGNAGSPGFFSYVAPKIGYQLTNRFRLNVGFMHYNMSGNSFLCLNHNEGLYNPYSRSLSGNMFFAEGEYALNKRYTVTGAVMTDVNSFNSRNAFKAASVGLDYKVTPHSTISIRTVFSQGNGAYMSTPFGTGSFGASSGDFYPFMR